MGSRRRTTSPRPGWFKRDVTRPSFWAYVRLDAEWIATVRQRLSDPEFQPTCEWLLNALRDQEAKTLDRFKRQDWAAPSSWQLVALFESHLAVQIGLDECLPSGADVIPEERWLLYVLSWAFNGMMQVDDADDEATTVGRILGPATMALSAYHVGPFVQEEMRRRGVRHVGIHAAVLLLQRASFRQKLRVEQLLDPVDPIEALRGSVWKRSLGALRRLCRDLDLRDRQQEVAGQIVETVVDRWRHVPILDLLARALDGELNVAPAAIVSDLMDRARKEMRRDRTEAPSAEAGVDERSREDEAPDFEASYRGLLQQLEGDSRLRDLVLAALSAGDTDPPTQREIGEVLGVGDRQVRNLIRMLKRKLAEMASR